MAIRALTQVSPCGCPPLRREGLRAKS